MDTLYMITKLVGLGEFLRARLAGAESAGCFA